MGGSLTFPKVPMQGRVVVVTGGNTGIGYETAKWCAMLGAHVIIACRSQQRATEAIERMQREFEEEKAHGTKGIIDADKLDVQFMELNCASLKSTEEFIKSIKAKEPQIHILVLNAGLGGYDLEYTEDGFELMFQVNYLSQVLTAVKLLPTMQQSGEDCRILLISSAAHQMGEFDLEKIQAKHLTNENFQRFKYYGNSKLYQVMLMFKLNERISNTNVVVTSIHPGPVDTEFSRYYTGSDSCCYKCFIKCFVPYCCCCVYRTPYEGATTQINAAVNPKFKGVRDAYFASCKITTPSRKARNKTFQDQLWKYSLDCLKNNFTEEDLKIVGESTT